MQTERDRELETRKALAQIPPAYGYVEFLKEEDGRLMLSGWMLGLRESCDEFWLVFANGDRQPIDRVPRNDLAKHVPHHPSAKNGGFYASVPLPKFNGEGVIPMAIVGVRNGQPAMKISTGYYRLRQPQPMPPCVFQSHATGAHNDELWRATGMKCSVDFRAILAPHMRLDAVRDLLDWGCGAGRLTVHLIDRFPDARVYGTDIDRGAVAWAHEHLQGTFQPCKTEPPLPYPDASFDLLIGTSVFTHLTADYQERWLKELVRVVRPGGVVLATTHGEFAGRWLFPKPGDFARVFDKGICAETRDEGLGAEVATGEYYRSTFQTHAWTMRTWGRWFNVVDFIEGGMNNFQDVYVLRRPA